MIIKLKKENKIMAEAKKDYLGLGRLVSIVLAIIPVTAWVLGIYTRLKEGHVLAGIIRIFGGWIIWVIDLVLMILKGHILRVA